MSNLTFVSFLCLLLFAFGVDSFSINSAEISGDGKDETRPAKQDTTIQMRCGIALSGREEWEACQWVHVIKGQYDQNNAEMNVKCTVLPILSGQVCSNHGGSHEKDDYARRIKFDVGQSHCGISIDKAHPDDTGSWECRVTANGNTQFNKLDLFVSNHSTVNISEPVSGVKIEYVFGSSRPEIRATCRGYGGRPAPTFNWYVNEDRYLLNKNDYKTDSIRTATDQVYGEYVYETITFTPDQNKLCSDYGLSSVCKNDIYTFKLICKTDQQSFYQRENADGKSEAIVEVRNGAQFLGSSFFTILVLFMINSKLS